MNDGNTGDTMNSIRTMILLGGAWLLVGCPPAEDSSGKDVVLPTDDPDTSTEPIDTRPDTDVETYIYV